MTCTPLPGGGFACDRFAALIPCVVCKKKPRTKRCDFQLRGPKAGSICGRDLCDGCAVHSIDNFDYCPTHAKTLPKPELHNKT